MNPITLRIAPLPLHPAMANQWLETALKPYILSNTDVWLAGFNVFKYGPRFEDCTPCGTDEAVVVRPEVE